MPSREECVEIFKGEESARKAFEYVQEKLKGIDEVPEDSMKPLSENGSHLMLAATKQELLNGIPNGLPKEYRTIARFLNDKVVVYGLNYYDERGGLEKNRAAFFRLSKRWVFIPRPFMAFGEPGE